MRRAGFEQVSQRGSHIKRRTPAGRTAIVPNHTEIARGTMRSILRQADLTLEEFEREPEAVLCRVCRFLGVNEEFEFTRTRERYNTGEAYEIPRLLARLLRTGLVQWMVARTPRGLRYRIRALLPRLVRRKGSLGRHQLTDQERTELLTELAPELRRLEEAYGIDVTRWWTVDGRALSA